MKTLLAKLNSSKTTPLFIGACAAVLITLGGCSTNIDKEKLGEHADFWQRSDTTSAIYTRGPKAQQMLNRDITNCVVAVRELNRLGALRHAFPGNSPADPSSPQGKIDKFDTPERTGYLRSEHHPYVDFETCMLHHGWERIEHVPYSVAERSRDTYIKTVLGDEYQTLYDEDGDRIPEDTESYEEFND